MLPRHRADTLNPAWLADFLALVASGTFSRAAEQRHMTQPAFSRRVRALEDWLGVALVEHGRQPLVLTPAGEWFRDVARELLDRIERLPGQALDVAETGAAVLRLAATHALSFTFLPDWLRRVESRTPVGPVQLVSDGLPRCEALLLAGEAQFVLMHAHAAVPGALDARALPSVRVGEDALVPVGAPGAPEVLLDYGAASGIGRIVRAVQGDALAGLPVAFKAQLASVLRSVALAGRGIAWLPRSLVVDDLASGRLVEAFVDRSVPVEIRLYRQAAPTTEVGEAFWTASVTSCGDVGRTGSRSSRRPSARSRAR